MKRDTGARLRTFLAVVGARTWPLKCKSMLIERRTKCHQPEHQSTLGWKITWRPRSRSLAVKGGQAAAGAGNGMARRALFGGGFLQSVWLCNPLESSMWKLQRKSSTWRLWKLGALGRITIKNNIKDHCSLTSSRCTLSGHSRQQGWNRGWRRETSRLEAVVVPGSSLIFNMKTGILE